MKPPGSCGYFTSSRNAEIMRLFRKFVAVSRHVSVIDIARRIAASPASRFWVSEERALHVVRAIIAGRPLPKMRPAKLDMFREIHARFIALKSSHPHLPDAEIIFRVVNQPAPRFYYTPATIAEFIYRIRQGRW